ncbi:UNVERIFIED_CONTAM: hypothetical protein GTU68_016706, partial [Idotea baltica]|nr:hypothetical protein [Idotea baltica]
MPEHDFILASSSPRRKELLERIGARFKIVPAEVDEFDNEDADPEWLVKENAVLKAAWVAARYPDDFVLGSDTTVHVDGRTLNKPKNMDEARTMIRSLAGRTHSVFTAY